METRSSCSSPRDSHRSDRWESRLSGRWQSGEFFLVQDDRAIVGEKPFDTLSVMGVDAETGRYFAQSFDNLGFSRRYDVSVNEQVWSLVGEHERATVEFSADGTRQTIVWEWCPNGIWLPLCDRVAIRER